MGLDMYLSARKYINKIDWSVIDKQDRIDYSQAVLPDFANVVNAAGLQDVENKNDIYGVQVSVNVAYWRKANQIHNWFVKNVQGGEDDCREYYVSQDKLTELLEVCRKALLSRDPQDLMPQPGFFFGSYDIDEYYWEDVKRTIKQLKHVIKMSELHDLSVYYQASW